MLEILKRNKEEIILVSIFMFFALGFNIYRVQGDGWESYAFLEKMLHISNPECSAMQLKNVWFEQGGNALFNAPFYLIAYTIEKIFRINLNLNGITLRQIFINLSSNFYMALSLILAVKVLKLLNFKYKILPVLSILFSTSAFTAAVIQPSWTHTVDIFVNTLLAYLFLNNANEKLSTKSFLLGLLTTLAILVRYANFLWMISLLVYYLFTKEYKKAKFFILGFISSIWILPILAYTYNVTSSRFNGTVITIDVFTSFIPRYLFKLLVHPLHGLFVWSPVTAISALGLLFFPWKKKEMGYLLGVIWFFFIFLHGFIYFWNAGWSFSNRYLVNLFPIYIIGLSGFLEKYGKKAVWLVLITSIYSIILFLNWHLCIMNPEFETPADLIRIWIKGKSSTFMDGTVNLNTVLRRLWEWCRYKYIFRFFK